MNWSWICRDCKKEYPENDEGLQHSLNPSGFDLKLCSCGGVVDLCPTKRAVDLKPAAVVKVKKLVASNH